MSTPSNVAYEPILFRVRRDKDGVLHPTTHLYGAWPDYTRATRDFLV